MGKNYFCFFQTTKIGKRAPDSSVKGSGANHYLRAPPGGSSESRFDQLAMTLSQSFLVLILSPCVLIICLIAKSYSTIHYYTTTTTTTSYTFYTGETYHARGKSVSWCGPQRLQQCRAELLMEMKWNYWGLRPPLCTCKINWGQENLLRIVRLMRLHFPPDTGFEIQALAVWGRARYLSVTEAPHNTDAWFT